jgi:hypothetical protein
MLQHEPLEGRPEVAVNPVRAVIPMANWKPKISTTYVEAKVRMECVAELNPCKQAAPPCHTMNPKLTSSRNRQ